MSYMLKGSYTTIFWNPTNSGIFCSVRAIKASVLNILYHVPQLVGMLILNLYGSFFLNFYLHTNYNSFYKLTKILTLEITICSLKMIEKSGLEKSILKFHLPFQRYLLICQANSVFLGRFFFCTGEQQLWRGAWYLKKNLDHFSLSFLIQKW